MSKTTAHRILQTLVSDNYAQACGEGVYAPGPALLALGGSTPGPADIVAAARLILVELQKVTGHTVHFAVRSGRAAVYVDKVEGDEPYQMKSYVGKQIGLYSTSIGKAVLAALPRRELDDLLGSPDGEHPPTAGDGVDPSRLRAELAAIAERGYSIDDEENEAHVRCVGAAVRTADGIVLGGISVSGLTFMFSLQQALDFGPAVAAAAEQVSAALGYRGLACP